MLTRKDCEALDQRDPLRKYRDRFVLPQGAIYLDGNSLGLMPKTVPARLARTAVDEWGQDLITSWNKHGWFELPRSIGNKIAKLIGAEPNSVVVTDTISVNLFKVLSAALALRRDRNVILSDSGNFPSDLYVAQGLNQFLADGHELRIVEPEHLEASISEDVAVVMATEVDYRTARRHDMTAIARAAHAKGALVINDLSHSAGAYQVNIGDADFAVGCTYKYLNGGPGAPGFVYVNARSHDHAASALVGWFGHARPFDFSTTYVPANGISRQLCGTQSVLAMTALDEAINIWADVDLAVLEDKSRSLCQAFIGLVEQHCNAFGLKLAGPRDIRNRGSHVSFHCPQGYAVMQALIARKVTGDFRAPDMIRFGFAALYNTHVEVFDAVQDLAQVLKSDEWNRPEYLAKKSVT